MELLGRVKFITQEGKIVGVGGRSNTFFLLQNCCTNETVFIIAKRSVHSFENSKQNLIVEHRALTVKERITVGTAGL